MAACSNCGQQNAEDAQFCSACGALLRAEADGGRELRKTVTVVFTDIANSTRLGEQLDPESHRRVMSRYFAAMRGVLEHHGGTVEKFIGDAVMAVFGIPVLHEDDALRAVRASAEMRSALAGLNDELQRDWDVEIAVRTGVNTGEVVAGEPGAPTLVTGDAVVVAKRLEETAGPNEIQLGESTYQLVREAVSAAGRGTVTAKGKDAIPVWSLVEVSESDGTTVRLDSPLVGRSLDLAALQETFRLVEQDRTARLFTVLGPAGIGKSRLTHEFVEWLGDRATVLRGRCLSYGDGITFWPLVEVVKQAAGLTDLDSPEEAKRKIGALLPETEDSELVCERISAAVGRGESAAARPDETFWAVRRLFEALARERPLVLVIDDLQWAETTFLDLLEYIAGWTTKAPVLLCCQARPELLELRPAWGLPRRNFVNILLEPLREHEADELIGNLLGCLPVPPEAHERVIEAAEGNPLFVEELLRMLLDEGLLRRTNGRWEAKPDLGELTVPATIHALLSARLDRLEPEERAVIQRASVAGQVFWWGAVAELSPEAARADVGAHLQSLVRRELIRQEPSAFGEEDAFRFGHILIRDAAYAALPKEARSALHEQLADWLERKAGDRAAEYEEIVGYHLEQAVRYQAELGRREQETQKLALEAGEKLASAGRRAAARADAPAAVSLLGRASQLLPVGAPGRPELLVDLGEALHEVGELQSARAVLQEALESSAGDEAAEASARLELANLRQLYDTESEALAELERAAVDAVDVFERLGDEGRLAHALLRIADAHWLRCQVTPVEPLLERARELALRARDDRSLSQIRFGLARAAALGPMPADTAAERCRHILEEARGDRYAEAVTANSLAYVEAMRGAFDEARTLAVRSRTILEDLGLVMAAAVLDAWAGQIELLAGDPAAAARIWRGSYETLEPLGERGNLSTIAAFLAEARLLQGAEDDADRLAGESEEAASADDLTSQIAWRGTRAKLLARQGRGQTAEAIAREGIELAERTEWPNFRGFAYASLAEVLAAGESEEAAAAAEKAVAIYSAKGNVAAAAQARDLLEGLVSSGTAPGGRAS
jgi:class 3 adenylate cyclase